jgi:O-antigen/teichoic acid export membrane protein
LRGEKLFKNTVVGVLSQTISALTAAIVQLVFIRFMIKEYLGAKSLFSNILDFLSLAELGIGLVLVYSMYQPLAEKNERKLIALTQFYRKAYHLIAAMVFGSGLCLMPFLSFFIENMESVPHARLIFFMYLVSSASSYLFVYKQSILNADQRIYITHLFSMAFSIIQCVLQIIVLVSGSKYKFFYYLIVQTVMVVFKNFLLTRKAERLYPFLNSREKILLTKDEKKAIYKNVFAMFNHRVGAVVLGSTDNLLISKFIGIIYCGFYGNFKMIVNLLNAFISQFFNAMLSSVGNMSALESKDTVYKTFKYLHFLSFWMHTFCTVAFIELANPVLMRVLTLMGVEDVQSYGFTFPTILMIGLNFYMIGIRKVPLTFKEAMGLLWYDRYKPIIEAVLNVVVSIAAIQKMGIAGIFFGTIFSMAATSLWVEPLVLFRHGLKRSMGEFWGKEFVYLAFSGGMIALTHYADIRLVDNALRLTGWPEIFAKLGICIILPNALIALCFCRMKEFGELFTAIGHIVFKKNKPQAIESAG